MTSVGDSATSQGDIPVVEQVEGVKEETPNIKRISPLNADFAKFAQKTLEKWNIPGISIAVVDGDETFAEVRIVAAFKIPQLTFT